MKFVRSVSHGVYDGSHPSRGAWIEIPAKSRRNAPTARRTPHGVRGLKSPAAGDVGVELHVAPLTGCVD